MPATLRRLRLGLRLGLILTSLIPAHNIHRPIHQTLLPPPPKTPTPTLHYIIHSLLSTQTPLLLPLPLPILRRRDGAGSRLAGLYAHSLGGLAEGAGAFGLAGDRGELGGWWFGLFMGFGGICGGWGLARVIWVGFVEVHADGDCDA